MNAALLSAGLALFVAPLPADEREYAACYARVQESGGNVVLLVGVDDLPEYVFKYRVPRGFRGLPDGVYDCWRAGDTPTFLRRTVGPAPAPAAVPAPGPGGGVTVAPPPVQLPVQLPVGIPARRAATTTAPCPNGRCPLPRP